MGNSRVFQAVEALKVEMILPSLDIGGMEIATRDLALALMRRGNIVGITCLEARGALADEAEDFGIPVRLVPIEGAVENFVASKNLVRHITRLSPDIVHCHNGVWGKAVNAAREAGAPIVVNTLHGFAKQEPRFYHLLRWWAARRTDWMIGVSPSLCDYLVRTLKVPPWRVAHIGNGVDLSRFGPGRRGGKRAEWGLAAEAQVLGCVARLDDVKNHIFLLEAMQEVARLCPNARLILVGDGPLRARLESHVSQLGLEGRVIFLGAVSDTAPLYPEFDVCVLPSSYEGTSRTLLEALATGVPIVATAVGGNSVLLDNGRCGTLVSLNDVQAMSRALVKILRNPAATADLSKQGLERARSFATETISEKVEALYRSLPRQKP